MTQHMTAAEYRALPKRRAGHRMILTPLDGKTMARGTLWFSAPPPSLNNAFKNAGRRGRIKTPAYKLWLDQAHRDLRRQASWHVPGSIAIRLSFTVGKFDIDNAIKPCLDVLVAAGRMSDDRNVQSILAERIELQGGPAVVVEIEALNSDLPRAIRMQTDWRWSAELAGKELAGEAG